MRWKPRGMTFSISQLPLTAPLGLTRLTRSSFGATPLNTIDMIVRAIPDWAALGWLGSKIGTAGV